MKTQYKILAAVFVLICIAVLFYYNAKKLALTNLIDNMNKINFGSDAEKANYIYSKIGIDEGGYVNDPSDNGGETYAGISRVFHPNWAGWPIIDSIKATRKIKYSEHIPELAPLHFQFFMDNYYNHYKTYLIKNTGMQYLYLDTIWSGHWQLAADSIRKVFQINTRPIWELDGIKFFNDESKSTELINELINQRISFVERFAEMSPKDQKYLAGWKARYASLLKSVTNLI